MNEIVYLWSVAGALSTGLCVGTAIIEKKEKSQRAKRNSSKSTANSNNTRANSVAAMATNKNMEDKERAKRLMETLKQLEG